ncbi:hypothetical protein Kpol_1026p11 [Vanderwaltozyma polyspora DSM 70294]|uniref:Initiation-specific alpha-1,6-mannosyltransferase n=1 Tax=Vanderwaltozyma polyspora (strain ATCC 22028 / DSM 70294 / BCRC 21397 / CBS 2163 / NBRC 10782 / NRRL Y-8283 / UCD 57-17) TaxID=436907 RepID=A7TNI1_VANPO|nr:uncharacterized protein Kpol_1026p11 [Vanderwaltozyma polyspora DSM 70294]EDO16164.1 hypothetical protein Kpol_1026p11 [Vanderwaltozyma polyspora DSM 70294]
MVKLVPFLRNLFASKRGRLIIVSIILIYSFFSIQISNNSKFQQFDKKDLPLPTTSHSDSINLKKTDVNNSNDIDDLRKLLSFAFPYYPKKPIPRRIWQTWKVDTSSEKFPSDFRTYQKEWTSKSYDYSLIPDDKLVPFLENLYAEVPQVIEAFKAMPMNILKADFFRYLLLFARGGIYSDMDTIPLKDLENWPSVDLNKIKKIKALSNPIQYKNLKSMSPYQYEPGLVIGIEADPDREDWSDWYARRIQFCQWTIQAKPGHPALRELILNITTTTLSSVESTNLKYSNLIDQNFKQDYNVNYRHKRRLDTEYDHSSLKNSKNVDGSDIMNWTGPGIFSDIIFDYLNNLLEHNNDVEIYNSNLNGALPQRSEKKENFKVTTTRKFYEKITNSLKTESHIPWEFFSLISEPVLLDDVMVLPITSFSPDVGQMGAKSSSNRMALVKHMFSGSWKKVADKNAGH